MYYIFVFVCHAYPDAYTFSRMPIHSVFKIMDLFSIDRHKRVFPNEGKDRARDNLDRLAYRRDREHLLEMITEKGVSAWKRRGEYINRGVGVVRQEELKLEV